MHETAEGWPHRACYADSFNLLRRIAHYMCACAPKPLSVCLISKLFKNFNFLRWIYLKNVTLVFRIHFFTTHTSERWWSQHHCPHENNYSHAHILLCIFANTLTHVSMSLCFIACTTLLMPRTTFIRPRLGTRFHRAEAHSLTRLYLHKHTHTHTCACTCNII